MMRTLPVLALALMLAAPGALRAQDTAPAAPPDQAASAPDPNSVTAQLFGRDLLKDLARPTHFAYGLRLDRAGQPEASGNILMDVREVAEDGTKQVWFKMDGAAGDHDFGPVSASTQNPLVIVYLQLDVAQLQELTGGSQHYFRNRIREAFNRPAKVEPVKVEFGGRSFEATRLTIQPFTGDQHLARFPALQAKTYAFTVAPGLPGGVYAIRTEPGSDGGQSSETLTLAGVE